MVKIKEFTSHHFFLLRCLNLRHYFHEHHPGTDSERFLVQIDSPRFRDISRLNPSFPVSASVYPRFETVETCYGVSNARKRLSCFVDELPAVNFLPTSQFRRVLHFPRYCNFLTVKSHPGNVPLPFNGPSLDFYRMIKDRWFTWAFVRCPTGDLHGNTNCSTLQLKEVIYSSNVTYNLTILSVSVA